MRARDINLRPTAASKSKVFWITDAHTGRMISLSPGSGEIWGYARPGLSEAAAGWLAAIHPEDRDRVLKIAREWQPDEGYDVEYRLLRPEGTLRWIHDRALPVCNEAGTVDRVAGLTEDITERKRLEKEFIELNDRLQASLGRQLHDDVCQQLLSIAFATEFLRRDLSAKAPVQAVRADQITALLDDAIRELRTLSHILCPIHGTGDGLPVALHRLASDISRESTVVCMVDCPENICISDNALSLHLYRIAQEAVQSILKRTTPGHILIQLVEAPDTLHLRITDDGDLSRAGGEGETSSPSGQLHFRAALAGGKVDIRRGSVRGTTIHCTFQSPAVSAPAPLQLCPT